MICSSIITFKLLCWYIMRIGIDVGGTNTDAVLIGNNGIISWCKTPTTKDISKGIIKALTEVMIKGNQKAENILAVMIGTTHFTNAVVERKKLLEIGIIRLGLPATSGVMPLSDWPNDLSIVLGNNIFLAHGGYEFDGRKISDIIDVELEKICLEIKKKELRAVAITSVFSPVKTNQEEYVSNFIKNQIPEIKISLSNEIGRVGFLERENACIMNACLLDLAHEVVSSFKHALRLLNIKAPFFISQNDGTLMSAEHVMKYPVLTFASGPTNSMRGAANQSKLNEAMIVDIGGTTSDIGMLLNGFPREASVGVEIGGVRTNFRMPDVLAIGLGGGSLVSDEGNKIGPESVGFELLEKSLVFGGDVLTATDIAVASGILKVGDRRKVEKISSKIIINAQKTMHKMLDDAIDKMKTSPEKLPVILVGGGSILINEDLPSASEIIRPKLASVANAVGAGIAQVGGEVDRIFSIDDVGREKALKLATEEASNKAIKAGAISSTINVLDIEEIPLAYLPSNASRIRVKVVGDLEMSK